MNYIDLRSDTVTMPTKEMRELMATAEVGDDVYGDDPTVLALEKLAAELLHKEDALFVPSGTFGNQVAILTHTKRGDEILLGADSHILMHEVGSAAVIAGVQTRTIPIENKYFDPKKIELAIRKKDLHFPDTGLICIENARSDGSVLSLQNMQEIKEVANKYNIPVHLDGARYFNASKALGLESHEMAECADSINICLSKGLCAPIGSLLVGNKAFIEKARKNRKLMGGGMRQAGVLAAPAIYALNTMVNRLEEDHANAKYLAEELDKIEGITVKKDRLDINMVFFQMPESLVEENVLIEAFYKRGIKINGIEDGEYRFVTNNGVSKKDIDFTVTTLKEVLLKK